jgi:hypothetical protein
MTAIQQEIEIREQALALLRIEWEQMFEQFSLGSEDKRRPTAKQGKISARQGKMNKSETRRSSSAGRYDAN